MNTETQEANANGFRTTQRLRRVIRPVIRGIKPIVRKGYELSVTYPEIALFAGAGYWLGSKLDETPVLGRATGGSAKLILASAGAIYGYNRAILRRTLKVAENGVRDAFRERV